MSLSFHIGFNGQCEEAFGFYAEALGGTIGTLLRVVDSPIAATSEAHARLVSGVQRTDAQPLLRA
jgi:PhnB protein